MAAPVLIAGAAWTALLVLATHSPPGTRVILLPQDDGAPSAVLVRNEGGQQLISQPYQRANVPINPKSALGLDQADSATVQAEVSTRPP